MDRMRRTMGNRAAVLAALMLMAATPAARAQTQAELEALRGDTLARINAVRSLAGLDPVVLDPELSRGAQEHALYLVANRVDPRSDVHSQDARLPGASAAGARAAAASVIMERVPPTDAVSFHLSTLFHRLPLVAPGLRSIGVGAARGEPWVWATVLDVQSGLGASTRKEPVWIPGDRSTGIPTTFGLARPGLVVHESPDPLAGDLSAGYPITVGFPKGSKISGVEFRLSGPAGAVPVYVFWPDRPPAGVTAAYLMDSVAAVPKDPLSRNTRYRATLKATVDGKPYEAAVEFSTGDDTGLPALEGAAPAEPEHAYWFEKASGYGPWGLMDETGRVLLEPRFDAVRPFAERRAAVNAGGESSISGRVSGGLWGLVDTRGGVMVQPRYDELRDFSGGRAAFRVGKLWGFLDPAGREAIAARYDEARDFSEGLAAVRAGTAWGFIDTAGKTALPFAYEGAGPFSEGKAAVRLGGKWGYVGVDGRMVIAAAWDQAWPFSEGFAPVRTGGPWGLVDAAGRVAVEPAWDLLMPPSAGRAVAGRAGLQGLIDLAGRQVLAPTYASIDSFSEDRALVEDRSGRLSFIDRDGKQVAGWFLHAEPFSGGRAAVADTRQAGFIGPDGAWLLKNPTWSSVAEYEGPLAPVELRDMDQAIDATGRVLWAGRLESLSQSSLGEGLLAVNGVESGYARLDGGKPFMKVPYWTRRFSQGLAAVRDPGGRWGYLDAAGTLVVPPRFDDAGDFADGLAPVKLGKLWGYADRTGRMAIPARWDFASVFVGGRAVVRLGTRMGIIDAAGREVLPLGERTVGQRSRAEGEAGWFVVTEGGKAGFMDASGSWKLRPAFGGARGFSEGLAAVLSGSLWGYADTAGKMAIPARYQEAWPFSEGLARVKSGDRYGYIDRTGKTVIPFEFAGGREALGGTVWLAVGEGGLPPRWGLATLAGEWLIPPSFDAVLKTWPGGATVRFRTGPSAWVDRDGKIIKQW